MRSIIRNGAAENRRSPHGATLHAEVTLRGEADPATALRDFGVVNAALCRRSATSWTIAC